MYKRIHITKKIKLNIYTGFMGRLIVSLWTRKHSIIIHLRSFRIEIF